MVDFNALMASMPFLEIILLNNRVLDYFMALLLALGVWIALVLLKRYGLDRLSQAIAPHSPVAANILSGMQEAISPYIFPLIALYLAVQKLTTSEKFDSVFGTAVVFFLSIQLTILIAKIANVIIMRLTLGRAPEDLSLRNARRNIYAVTASMIWVAGALFFLANIGVNITTFIAGLGIGGIAIALAVQSVLGDVLSSFAISIDKPFEIGDAITIDNFSGTVEQIGLKTTRIRSVNGELLIFGNQDLTKSRIKNFKRMHNRRVMYRIGVAYGTGVAHLREIPAIVKSIIDSQKDLIFDRCHFLEFGASSLNFEIVYFVRGRDYRMYCDNQETVNLRLAEEFEKRSIALALPTQSLLIETLPSALQKVNLEHQTT